MTEHLTDTAADLKAWMLLHRIRDHGFYLQDRICSEHGLTVEQYTVLVAIKYHDAPVTMTDIGRWMGHPVNTVSMLADRMFNAGLLDRHRDLPDRRRVRVTVTKKGEEAFKQATPAAWSFIEATMSSLSQEEKDTLIRLPEKVRNGELQHYRPDDDARISGGYETSDVPRLIERLGKYARRSARGPEPPPVRKAF